MNRHKGMKDGTSRVADYAKQHGFMVTKTRGGHLRISKPGMKPLFFSGTPSDHRAWRNAIAKIRNALREVQHATA